MNRELLHPIEDHEIATYETDGAVCIRAQFDRDWVQLMHEACIRAMSTPG